MFGKRNANETPAEKPAETLGKEYWDDLLCQQRSRRHMYVATHLLQGMLSHVGIPNEGYREKLVQVASEMADELITKVQRDAQARRSVQEGQS